jgi:uracil-DNA glycosylase family 4
MPCNTELCQGCPIEGLHRPVEPTGFEDAPYLIVTDTPSKAGAKEGRLIPPASNLMLFKNLDKEGFDPDDFQVHPLCLCAYDQDQYKNTEKKKIHKHCRAHLEDFIDDVRPRAILPLGAEAASQVFNKSTKITQVRGLGHMSEEFGVPIFPLMSPGLAVRYAQNEPVLAADCRSFGRLADANFDVDAADDFVTGEYIEVDDLQFLIDMEPELLSFDTETTGLRWYQRGVNVRTYVESKHKGKPWFQPRFQILTMQFTVEAGKSYILVWDHPERPIPEDRKPRLRNQLRKLLCNPNTLVVGQGLKFDNVGLWMSEGIRFEIGGDTAMLCAIHDENLPEKNLDILTKLHVPEMAGYADRFNTTVDKSRMWEVPIKTMIPYGGGDTDAAFRVYEKLEDLVAADAKNWNHYCEVSIPGLNALAGLETRGMYVDLDHALPEFQTFLEAEVLKQRDALLAQVHRDIKMKHIELKKGNVEEALKLSRQDFLKDILFYHPKGFRLKPKVFTKTTEKLPDHMKEPSCSSKDHLPYFFEDCPFTFELSEYVKDATLLNNNVVNFQDKFVVDGMVRPTYFLDKAVTRRTSSKDPNGQNFPKRGKKAKMYQKSFIAPEGWVVIQCDLSQAELRIAGDMANDQEIIRIYNANGDIHITTACLALNVTEAQFKLLPEKERKEWRQKAKAINFGFIYGMSWRKFMVYAKTQYGVEFTEKESKAIRSNYFKKYKGLARWHEVVKDYVAKHGQIRSYSGLLRHLPQVNSEEEYIQAEAMRQGINSPVQEFGSTLGVISLGRMNEEIDPEYMQIFGFIHDAIYAYVREEHVDWGLKTLKHYMQSNDLEKLFGRKMKVPIIADAAFGWNQGELFELGDYGTFDLKTPYDFTQIKDKDGKQLVHLPRQTTPPNRGRLRGSPYTLATDLEDETVQHLTRLRRTGVGVASRPGGRTTSAKRIVRPSRVEADEPAPTPRLRRTRASV